MPELPDVLLYVSALKKKLLGQTLRRVIVRSPSLLKTFHPSLDDIQDRELIDFSRCGKRVVWHLDGGLYLVVHLMIAGRFHWKNKQLLPRGKHSLAAFAFGDGTLMLTEASQKKRAGLWCMESLEQVAELNAGGIDVLQADDESLRESLLHSNHTLKRALADPSCFDGIGNAYSDEILHAARLSPLRRTKQLDEPEMQRLTAAMRHTLTTWIDRLQIQAGNKFPEKVTALRPEMAVHGKFGQACPDCGAPVQRIRYADNECNYCPGCQTEGRILADRSLSRLLKDDWPRSLDELETG